MRKIVAVTVLTVLAIAALPFLLPHEESRPYQGWVEADMRMIGAESVGRLTSLAVEEGATITAGEPLFALDDTIERATLAAAEANLAGAQAELNLARVAQKRPEEVDVLRAAEREADARLALSVRELERMQALVRQGSGTRADLDAATATEAANRAALDSVRSQITLATLPARDQAIQRAEEAVHAAAAQVNSAKASLSKRSIVAPALGTVQTIYYRPGEVVPAGRPVVALLPPSAVRIRFFVPQDVLPALALGQIVRGTCDGCEPFEGRISFIADEAEYTPPVIFSREERAKLVYGIEALPARPKALRVGQPVDVVPGTLR
ncbi:HlyD family secretion protein [Pseudorhizobium tarimense]|uniref:HlyD family secretion protein n=1 Tax=Pseudorhizobium tarimense TaxID=1079109 RepID=A0ABV2HCJ4_9HYPH|nr:HlyD family efflux transporter periplasmic adaptor subunit [Pseudorhizobium tarimense]MCJ8521316.1 HlyD family efflux transporter periplasmic adaptor subunit [Pseudorhizobium tarimense]